MIFALTGCAYFTHKTPIAKLAEKYTVITATLVAPAELRNGNSRLIIYFRAKEDGVTSSPVLMCLAANSSNKDVLVNVREYLYDSYTEGRVIYIYGKPIHGSWQEYLVGMHCYIKAIGFYVAATDSYSYLATEYGDGAFDNFSWLEFMKKLGAAAAKKAL